MRSVSSDSLSNSRPALIKIKHLNTVRFDRNNYMVWKAHTLAHLRGYDLIHFVEQLITTEDPALTQQDQLLLAWLLSAISPFVLPQITACHTAYDIWRTLKGIFNVRSKLRIIQLQNELSNVHKDSLSMDEFFAKITALSEELREAGVPINDGKLSLITLDSLDSSYDPFITSQTARVEEIPFSSLLGLLLSYDQRLTRNNTYESRGIATTNNIQSSSIVICQICDKKGHPARACFNRYNEQRFPSIVNKSRPQYKNNKSSNNTSTTTNSVWYPDNGASDHVTSDSTQIPASTNDASRAITVANGFTVKE